MPTTNINQRVARIAGLEQADKDALTAAGIDTEDDLSFVSFPDFDQAISVVKRRKLDLICTYLAGGDALNANSTMQTVRTTLANRNNPVQVPAAAAAAAAAQGQGGNVAVNADKGAPRVHTDPLPKFSGDPVDYEEWERKAGAIINQTAYKHYLSRAATAGNVVEENRSSELYYMLVSCVGDGHALNTVEKIYAANNNVACGYQAWTALKNWYMDASQVNTMIAHYEGKLNALILDNDMTATEFINNYELYVRKLEKLEGPWTDDKKVREFKDRVVADDYDTEVRIHTGTFADLIKSFRKREQDLEKKANIIRKQRRYKTPEHSDEGEDESSSESRKRKQKPTSVKIPFIPTFLYKSMSPRTRKNVTKWRSLVNNGKEMVPDDLEKEKTPNSDEPTETSSKKKSKTGGKKQRRTKTVSFGTSDTVMVKLASDDEEYSSELLLASPYPSCGYDSQTQLTPGQSEDVAKIRRTTSVGMSRGRSSRQPYAVIDPGAEEEMIGGLGWCVLYKSDQTESLSGPIEGMGTMRLPKVDAVTAVKDKSGNTILLGVGNTTWDRRTSQYESLWNSHHLREYGTIVNDVAKSHGGSQNMVIRMHDGSQREIPLGFDGDIMKVNISEPTEEELATLRVVWITPTIDGNEYTPQSLRRSRVAADTFQLQIPGQAEPVSEEEQPTEETSNEDNSSGKIGIKDWKALLGFPSDQVLEKTLNATTQLCAEPIEAERREIPRQHRKKRLLPLHPRRLKGRVDSDTFFSTVKSIRNYKCVQFFVHVESDYLFVRCLQREAHSHGAYQDFIREVGAPQVIVTDNSQTQTGQKWEATSRGIMTKQRTFAPHNQNQNKAERRIGDVKHKVVHVLQRAGAPLIFWCYCLIFVVDCLNHIAKKGLEWRTSQEVLNGDTPDISPFRFSFWQEIEYFEPTAKFPESRWCKGRFLGIAWHSGDDFTFKIWTEPDGKGWKGGRELVRNIVRARKKSEDEVKQEPEDMSHFKFQKKTRTKKRRGRRRQTVFQLEDIEEFEGGNEDNHGLDDGAAVGERTVNSAEQSQLSDEDGEPDVAGGREDAEQNTHNQHTNTTQNVNISAAAESDIDPDPGDIEQEKEVNEHFANLDEEPDFGGSRVTEIIAHEWRLGHPTFKVKWSGGDDTTWETLADMRQDYPKMTAQYIVDNKVSRSKRGGDRVLKWANKVVRDMDRAIRRIVRLYDFYLDEEENVKCIRRTQKKGSRKKKKPPARNRLKYGIKVPVSVEEALAIDAANGNTLWRDAMGLEVGALLDLNCFEFKPKGWTPGEPGYQKTNLHMVFDVKHDLRRKARLVAGGHLVDVTEPVYSSTVKSISVQLLHVIAHKAGMEQLCGDIGNAFPNAYTNEKVYIPVAGPEFGEHEGKAILIRKAIYGLASSSERFHCLLADTLRLFGWKPTRFDNDVWIRLDETGKMYEYLCTHVDDFMIVSRKPETAMAEIQSVYLVKDSSKGPPDYYLGNDYKKDKKGRWCIGCKKYLTEAVSRVEKIFGELPKKVSPMEDGDHPEEDCSALLDDDGHQKYQMLIGMLNWIVCLGRMDVAFATTSLSRFTACPRAGHLERALRIFGYLKKNKNRRIVVDSRDPILVGGEDALAQDYTEIFKNTYPDAAEEVDADVPIPLIDELEIVTFVDSDHAHDKVTRRSITGILIVVGRTPVFFSSKRQGAIETSTYGAEFCAMRSAVEEVQSVRYMLRCLGVKVTRASLLCGDNLGVIQNCTMSESLLKKKHVAIAFHKTREASAAGIVHPIKTKGSDNYSDLLTKAITGKTFWKLYGGLTRG